MATKIEAPKGDVILALPSRRLSKPEARASALGGKDTKKYIEP